VGMAVVLVCRWMLLWWRWGLEEHTTLPILCRKPSPPQSLPHFLSLPPSLACFLSLLPPIFPPSPLPPTLSPSPPPPSQPLSLHSNPRVTAITSLGYDHVDILGDTLAKIAWQKGGICKVSPCTLSQSTNCCWMSKPIAIGTACIAR